MRLLQSAPVVRALTNQAAGGAGYWPQTAQRLQAIAAQNPDLRDTINTFINRGAGAALIRGAWGR
jgi:hypothetical protein